MKRFVYSHNDYKSIKEAELKINNRFANGDKLNNIKLYEVKTVYYPKIRFVRTLEVKEEGKS